MAVSRRHPRKRRSLGVTLSVNIPGSKNKIRRVGVHEVVRRNATDTLVTVPPGVSQIRVIKITFGIKTIKIVIRIVRRASARDGPRHQELRETSLCDEVLFSILNWRKIRRTGSPWVC